MGVDYLSYYSKVFDFVEIDLNRRTSSLYKNQDIATATKLPNKLLFKKWAENTPDNFRFAIKLPLDRFSFNNIIRTTPRYLLEKLVA